MDVCEYGNCGSRQFHVGDDGYTYCTEGHRQFQSGLVTVEEDEVLPSTARRARREKEDETAQTALTGREALEHYLICFQLIIWKQAHWMVTEQGFPSELESIVRDLWTIRLQHLQIRLNDDDEQVEQFFSSQTEADTSRDEALSKTQTRVDGLPNTLTATCMVYLACVFLRSPILVADIFKWINNGDFIYYRAIKTLDVGMKNRLPARYNLALDPQILLTTEKLQKALADTVTYYKASTGMDFPTCNYHLWLYRFVRDLNLPLEVYAATLRLANLLDIEFDLANQSPQHERLRALRPPENRLLVLLVIATKLLFPSDSQDRTPRRPIELAVLGFDWAAWNEARRNMVSTRTNTTDMSYNQALRTTDIDVVSMSEDKLDQYMDWYEKVYVEEQPKDTLKQRREAGFRSAMYRMFPVSNPANAGDATTATIKEHTGSTDQDNAIKSSQARLRPLRVMSDQAVEDAYATVVRPGDHYERYRETEELTGTAKVLYEEAASVVGMSVEALVQGVFAYEKRLEEWSKRRDVEDRDYTA